MRIRLARWIMRVATWLAWRIGGKAAFGRELQVTPEVRIVVQD